MNFLPRALRWKGGPSLAILVSISVLTGCNRDETRVYHVDKDDTATAQPAPPPVTATAPPAPSAAPENPQVAPITPDAQLQYRTPAGWEKKPLGEMRVASFTAPGLGRESSDVSVIPLHVAGHDLDLINLWRSQVNLPPTDDPATVRQAQLVAVGTDQGRLFRFVSEKPMLGKFRQQILVTMLTRGDTTWFFRVVGPDPLVDAQKKTFLAFLKSVSFVDNGDESAAPKPDAATASAPSPENKPPSSPTVPPDWTSVPPAQFLVAEYNVSGPAGAKAAVNVAVLKGNGGGLLANANRWRGQIGLNPLDEAGLSKHVQTLDVPGGKATLVDFTGADTKSGAPTELVGAMVEQDGQSWFYKLMGDPPVVVRQKSAFEKFIRSAPYANAR